MKHILVIVLLFTQTIYAADALYRQLKTEQGRFVFGDMENESFYMLDTQTGQIWKMVGNTEDPKHFEPIPYLIKDESGKTIGRTFLPITQQRTGGQK